MLLKDAAYTAIKDFLFKRADPIEAYSERTLAATLGLGLASVRSAVERLRAEGWSLRTRKLASACRKRAIGRS